MSQRKKLAAVPPKTVAFNLPAPPPSWPQKPAGISFCMIVKNEERFLADCLASIKDVADEICVVDTGSTDRTVEIAESFGARVEHHTWRDDFAWARNKALDMATKRWILTLDADEHLTPESAQQLRALRDAPAFLAGLWVRCFNASDDYKGTGALSNAIIRIFPNHERVRYRNRIHEFISLDDSDAGMPAQKSDIAIIHVGYLHDVMAARDKTRRNFELCRTAVEEEPENAYNWCNFGMSANLAGEYETGIMALERMREMTRGQSRGYRPHALVTLANLYMNERRDYAKAIEIARECLEDVPNYADAHFSVGKALTMSRRFHEARDAYGAAIAAGEFAHEHFVSDHEISAWKAHSEIAYTLLEEQRYDLALAWCDMGLQNRPKAQPLHFNRAKALEGMQRFDEAQAAYREVFEMYRDTFATVEYVNYLLRRGNDDLALSIVDSNAHTLGGNEAVMVLAAAAAIVLRSGGQPDRARGYVRHALSAGQSEAESAAVIEALSRHLGEPRVLHVLDEVRAERESAIPRGLRISAALA